MAIIPAGICTRRNSNPNRVALEAGVRALEGGAEAAAFSSGMGAAMALFQSLQPGDHIVAHIDAYYGMTRLLEDFYLGWGLQADFADMSNLDELKKKLRKDTKLVWAETPSNPLLKIVDLAAVAEIAHGAGALCVCDNTWAPVIQRPFDLGLDLILHSTTKYFGGHCDVLGGILVSKKQNTVLRAGSANSIFRRRRPLALRLLARSSWHANTTVAHTRSL